ncbi:MAG: single-stranded DNA-binding protein [Christensenellaceae bacterium]|jgi:single-strand DNA-binding protein|nr:single-stranded DNA-binding protein [Christensenellaceae bacterium]
MNKVFLIGNLTRDPELTTVGAENIAVCRFGLAVSRRKSRDSSSPETDFFNISVWRQQGENCAKYLAKGRKVAVTGQIQIHNYEDKEGVKKIAVDIVADDVEFLTPRGEQAEQAPGSPSGFDAETPNKNEMKPVADDSLPF